MGGEGYTSELALLPLVASLVLSCGACEHHVLTFIPPPTCLALGGDHGSCSRTLDPCFHSLYVF